MMRGMFYQYGCVAWAAAYCSTSAVGRQAADEKAIQQWIQTERAAAEASPNIPFVHMSWREESFVPNANPAELERLRAEVAGKPDHPKLRLLERMESQLRGNPKHVEVDYWSDHSGRWRCSRAEPGPIPYVDQTARLDSSWVLTPVQLTLMPPSGVRSEFDLGPTLNRIRRLSGFFLYGGLHLGHGADVTVTSMRMVDRSAWSANLHIVDRYDAQLSGQWDPMSARGFIRQITLDPPPGSPEEYSHWSIDDWTFHPEVDRWAAHRVEQRDRSGQLVLRLSLLAVDRISPEQFESIAAIPPVDGIDALRGAIAVSQVLDLRPESAGAMARQDGALRPLPLDSQLVKDAMGRSRVNSRLRIIGWITLASLVVLLVTVRFMNRRVHSLHPSPERLA